MKFVFFMNKTMCALSNIYSTVKSLIIFFGDFQFNYLKPSINMVNRLRKIVNVS